MGFEPMGAEHNGLAVHRLNHSATSSCSVLVNVLNLRKTRSFQIVTSYRFEEENAQFKAYIVSLNNNHDFNYPPISF